MNISVATVAGHTLTVTSVMLISFGVGTIIYSSQANSSMVTASPVILTQPTNSTRHTLEVPSSIRIAKVGINLQVAAGTFMTSENKWAVNDDNAFFAESTVTPIIYGHNTAKVFAPLSKLVVGDTMQLSYANGSSQDYTFIRSRIITANDASILTEHNKNTVLLLTCDGMFNESRRVAYFEINT